MTDTSSEAGRMAGLMLSDLAKSHESEQWGMVLVGEGFGHSDGKAGRRARMEGLRDCIGSGGLYIWESG